MPAIASRLFLAALAAAAFAGAPAWSENATPQASLSPDLQRRIDAAASEVLANTGAAKKASTGRLYAPTNC